MRAVEHESLKTTYRGLLMKKDQAILRSLERRQIGEQFKLLDRRACRKCPSVPIAPA